MSAKLRAAARSRHRGKHLHVSELIDESAYCPICLDREPRRARFSVQDDPPVSFLECRNCHGVSASMMPSAESLNALYANFYGEEDEKYTTHNPLANAKRILRAVNDFRDLHEGVRILEVGGGDGTLSLQIAYLLRERNPALEVDIVEVELFDGEDINQGPVSLHFERDIEDVAGEFDLVFSNAALHQIPALNSVLSGMFDRVRSGGYFYATTAYLLPIARVAPKLIDTLYPLHVHDLGCAFWNRIVTTFALPARVVSSRPSMVETVFRRAPLQSIVAHTMKLPALIETALYPPGRAPLWRFVGGWEVTVRFRA